jgi:hypothetical protein
MPGHRSPVSTPQWRHTPGATTHARAVVDASSSAATERDARWKSLTPKCATCSLRSSETTTRPARRSCSETRAAVATSGAARAASSGDRARAIRRPTQTRPRIQRPPAATVPERAPNRAPAATCCSVGGVRSVSCRSVSLPSSAPSARRGARGFTSCPPAILRGAMHHQDERTQWTPRRISAAGAAG